MRIPWEEEGNGYEANIAPFHFVVEDSYCGTPICWRIEFSACAAWYMATNEGFADVMSAKKDCEKHWQKMREELEALTT